MRKLFLAAALLAPAAAFANGYHLPISNPRDLSLGGSGTQALQNSAAAVYTNPAALAGMDGLQIAGSAEVIALSATWKDPKGSGATTSTVPKAAFPPAAYVSYGGRASNIPWAVGAGFTVAGGGLFVWPGDWPGKASIASVDRKVFAIDLVAAAQPIEQLKIGVGLVRMQTEEKLRQVLPFGDATGDVHLGAAGGAWSFHAGAEAKIIDNLKFGLDYRHKAHMKLEGDAHFDNIPATFATILRDQRATHELIWPNILQAGLAYQVTPDLLVNLGYIFVRWIVYKDDVFNGSQGLTVKVPHDFKNSFGFSLGGEYALPVVKGLKIRAGVERVQAPANEYTEHPAIPDANSTAFTLGVGYAPMDNLDISAGYKVAILDTITTKGAEAFPGTYNTTAHFISVGAAYRFAGLGAPAAK